MTLDEWLRLIGTLLPAVSITVTAVFAILGLNTWRRQMVGKRRMEVAENVLLGCFRCRDAIKRIRSPLSYEYESRDRPREKPELENESRWRDTYYLPLARIAKEQNLFDELSANAYLAQIYFGPQIVDQFIEIRDVVFAIASSAHNLYQTAVELPDRDIRRKWEANIWDHSMPQSPDNLAARVDAAVAKIEALCSGHVRPPEGSWLASLGARVQRVFSG